MTNYCKFKIRINPSSYLICNDNFTRSQASLAASDRHHERVLQRYSRSPPRTCATVLQPLVTANACYGVTVVRAAATEARLASPCKQSILVSPWACCCALMRMSRPRTRVAKHTTFSGHAANCVNWALCTIAL